MDNETLTPLEPLTSATYLKVIKLYQWIFAIFGVNLPPPLYFEDLQPSKKRIIFGVYGFYCLVKVSAVVYITYLHNIVVTAAIIRHQLDSITKILSLTQNFALAVIRTARTINMILQYRELVAILNLIQQLENGILSYNIYRRIWKIFGSWLIVLVFTLMYLNYYLIACVMDLSVKIINALFIVAMQMKCLEYGLYIQIVYSLLDSVWKSLESLKMQMENSCLSAGSATNLPRPFVRQLIRNHRDLNSVWILVTKINHYFGIPIFLIFFNNAVAILYTVNWAYVRNLYELEYVHQTFRFSYIAVLLMNLLMVCSFTEKCLEKYRSIAALIHDFKLSSHGEGVIMRLREYSLQLAHLNLNFTCHNYLDIDFRNFGKMILVIIGYMVSLLQFKMEDASSGVIMATQKIFGKKLKLKNVKI